MRCRACDSDLRNQAYYREVTLEDGSKLKVVEDLCRECRAQIFRHSLPEDFDLIGSLGYDVDGGQYEGD